MTWQPRRMAAGLAGGGLALFALGTNVQAGWLLVLAALLFGSLVAGALLPLWALRGVVAERRAPATAWAGEPVEISLLVRNTGRGARGLLMIRDRFCGEGTAVVAGLAPAEERVFEGARLGARRGVYRSGPCEIATGAPFGVALVRRTVELPSRTTVYPRVFPVSLGDAFAGAGGVAARPRRAPSGDTATVRPYREGDPLRHVHWRSTARTGQLAVREFEDAGGGDLVVLADISGEGDELDTVASAACSIALEALRSGRRVTLAAAGRVLPAASEREILEWGARLETSAAPLPLDAARYAAALACVLAGSSRAGALVPLARSGAGVFAVVIGGDAPTLREAGARVVAVPEGEDPQPWLA